MIIRPIPSLGLLLFVCLPLALASEAAMARRAVNGKWTESFVKPGFYPAKAKTEPTPVIFAFHGQWGSMDNAARMFGYHRQWPEAIVVYMQGLHTPAGWSIPRRTAAGVQQAWATRETVT